MTTTNLKLYEITQQYDDIFARLYDEDTGEVNMEVQAELDMLDAVRDKKCIAVASYIKNLEAEYTAINEAKKAMAARETAFKRQMESYKSYLMDNMQKAGVTDISCPYFAIKLKKNPQSVDVQQEALIPEQYHRVTISYDKAAMLKDMKDGMFIPGAALKQDLSLQIR